MIPFLPINNENLERYLQDFKTKDIYVKYDPTTELWFAWIEGRRITDFGETKKEALIELTLRYVKDRHICENI